LGEYERARRVLEESQAIRLRMGNLEGVPLTEAMLGVVAAFEGDTEGARGHLRDGLAGYRRGAGEGRYLSWVLGVLAEVVFSDGGAEGAATILGAAEAVRVLVVDSTLPVLRDRAERVTAAARAAMDREGFEAAWSRGRRMTLVQAIDLAVGCT